MLILLNKEYITSSCIYQNLWLEQNTVTNYFKELLSWRKLIWFCFGKWQIAKWLRLFWSIGSSQIRAQMSSECNNDQNVFRCPKYPLDHSLVLLILTASWSINASYLRMQRCPIFPYCNTTFLRLHASERSYL